MNITYQTSEALVDSILENQYDSIYWILSENYETGYEIDVGGVGPITLAIDEITFVDALLFDENVALLPFEDGMFGSVESEGNLYILCDKAIGSAFLAEMGMN